MFDRVPNTSLADANQNAGKEISRKYIGNKPKVESEKWLKLYFQQNFIGNEKIKLFTGF